MEAKKSWYSADQYQILAGKIHELELEREQLRREIDSYKKMVEEQPQDDFENVRRKISRDVTEKLKEMNELNLARSRRLNPEPGTLKLPDAADLLNKLKSKGFKPKATLKDVESILDLIQAEQQ